MSPAFTPPLSITAQRTTVAALSTNRTPKPSTRMSSAAAVNPARTAVITGASGGIGEQTSKGLVRTLPNLQQLILCCRNVEKGEVVAQSLREGSVAGRRIDVDVVPVELASGVSTSQCASKVNDILGENSLDLLVCNAGVMACPLTFSEKESEQFERIEQQYFVNHLSHALLTTKLLPALRREDGGRVVFVSSAAVAISRGRSTAPVIAEKTDGVVTEDSYGRWKAYGDSKVAMSMFARKLAEVEGGIVESVSLHPGVVATDLGRHLAIGKILKVEENPSFLARMLLRMSGLKTAPQGAELSVELAAAPRNSLENGAMYVALGGKQVDRRSFPLLGNEEECARLYDDTMSFVNAF